MMVTGMRRILPFLVIAACGGAVGTPSTASHTAQAATASPSPVTSTAAIATRFKFPCGTVTAYTAPTASRAGSVSLGTAAFVLLPGSGPTNATQLTVGSSLCLNGDQDGAGAFAQFSISPMGEGICSVVSGHVPATATTAGSLDFATKLPIRLPVAPGVTFSAAQVSGDQCFRVVPDAQGTAHITAYLRPRT